MDLSVSTVKLCIPAANFSHIINLGETSKNSNVDLIPTVHDFTRSSNYKPSEPNKRGNKDLDYSDQLVKIVINLDDF